MRRFLGTAAVAACAVLFATSALAKAETVRGQIVDEGCSMKEMKSGDHTMPDSMKDCAIECAKKGEPVAIVTADGKVYRIVGGLAANNNEKLVPHMSHTVEITGDVSEKDGKTLIAADALK